MTIRKVGSLLLDIIFPPRCPICNNVMPRNNHGTCKSCRILIPYVKEPYCMKCGKPLDLPEQEYCNDCLSKEHEYEEGRAALVYDEYMSRSIYRFKYNYKREYAPFYGKIIYDRLGSKIKTWNCDALIPVPIHKSKLKRRGYNQAALIARQLSGYLNIPVMEQVVSRENRTEVQKKLGAAERENNLKKAFIVTQNVVKLNAVIIIDDIYTTGSTVDALAHCLKEAGVKKVYYIALCIGRGY